MINVRSQADRPLTCDRFMRPLQRFSLMHGTYQSSVASFSCTLSKPERGEIIAELVKATGAGGARASYEEQLSVILEHFVCWVCDRAGRCAGRGARAGAGVAAHLAAAPGNWFNHWLLCRASCSLLRIAYACNLDASAFRKNKVYFLDATATSFSNNPKHIESGQYSTSEVACEGAAQPARRSGYVAVPSARILGGPDLHVDMGSTINLTCLIQFSPEPPAYIFWYHEDEVSGRKQVISYDSSRGGVSVVTEKGAATTSYLLVQDAAPSDSGRYSCAPSNAELASVRVHVLNGERPAAMQTGSAGLSNSSCAIALLLAACVLHARLLRAQLAS
ncbi:unnamed protein product [Colias eurytheme]|nr:unnamed protein product [Colias eurytheme]